MHMLLGVTYYAARKLYPGATVIARCEGGYIAFDTAQDYATWRRQK